jgi:hypothetical protein
MGAAQAGETHLAGGGLDRMSYQPIQNILQTWSLPVRSWSPPAGRLHKHLSELQETRTADTQVASTRRAVAVYDHEHYQVA